jgi:hypothetical protein
MVVVPVKYKAEGGEGAVARPLSFRLFDAEESVSADEQTQKKGSRRLL